MSYRAIAGKEFEALSEKQRAFVHHYIELGGHGHVTDAVLMAGYQCNNRATAAALGCALLRSEKVLAALKRLAETHMQAEGVHFARVARTIALEGKTPQGIPASAELQLKAALEMMNRAGLAAAALVKHEHKHAHVVTDRRQEEVVENIYRLASQLGLETDKLSGLKALPAPSEEPMDAEFEEVPAEEVDWTQPV